MYNSTGTWSPIPAEGQSRAEQSREFLEHRQALLHHNEDNVPNGTLVHLIGAPVAAAASEENGAFSGQDFHLSCKVKH